MVKGEWIAAGKIRIYEGRSPRTGKIKAPLIERAILICFPDDDSLRAALATGKVEISPFGRKAPKKDEVA